MTDFKKAFQQGLAAHKDAETKRAEIREVIAQLSAQLGEMTGGAIRVTLKRSSKEVVKYLSNIVAAVTGNTKQTERVEYTAIHAEVDALTSDGKNALALLS